MKTIFDIVDDVLYKKPQYKLESSDVFSSYMVQRWISMANPIYCNFINAVYNINHNGFEDDQMVYDFLKCIFPKKYIGQIKYFKKEEKSSTSKNQAIIKDLAQSMELSQREIQEYINLFPDIIKENKDNDAKVLKKIDKAKDDV